MKKVSVILLSFIYVITLTGFSLSIHQCQGKTSFSVLGITFNKTCKCTHTDFKHASKCCSNSKIVIEKNTNDNFFQKDIVIVKANSSEFELVYQDFNLNFPERISNALLANLEAPPDISSGPLYIVNRVILL